MFFDTSVRDWRGCVKLNHRTTQSNIIKIPRSKLKNSLCRTCRYKAPQIRLSDRFMWLAVLFCYKDEVFEDCIF